MAINEANRKVWNRFGMVTRGDWEGANIEFAACTSPKEANKRRLMNKPRWFTYATPKAMDKSEAAAWFLADEDLLALFVKDMVADDGYTEEEVLKCLKGIKEKGASTEAPTLDLAAIKAAKAAQG